jgi:hypothetical protein
LAIELDRDALTHMNEDRFLFDQEIIANLEGGAEVEQIRGAWWERW